LITVCAREICLFDMNYKERISQWAYFGDASYTSTLILTICTWRYVAE
jgi:hypothetical protein